MALKPKYRVSTPERRTFLGRTYASRAEMLYATSLHDRVTIGDVVDYVEQPRLWLGVRENVYVPDFLVVPKEGDPHYVDVKGHETAAFKRNKRLWRSYGRLDLHVVRVDPRGNFATLQIIKGRRAR